MVQVGLISDTHGLLRPQAVRALADCDHIIHAGDICDPAILVGLGRIAPVTAVRGNNDFGPWADALPTLGTLRVGAIAIRVIHDVAQLDAGAAQAGVGVVVCGHSHRPRIDRRNGILYVNPGSAGPRRFTLPISIGRLRVARGRVTAQLHELETG